MLWDSFRDLLTLFVVTMVNPRNTLSPSISAWLDIDLSWMKRSLFLNFSPFRIFPRKRGIDLHRFDYILEPNAKVPYGADRPGKLQQVFWSNHMMVMVVLRERPFSVELHGIFESLTFFIGRVNTSRGIGTE
ncbi:hypothetical protein GJ744_011962 [Endocarpon pusillum]|uniref:Uncharacterized protein n=1 Tax=Endocarpon pusillum TaxID=364733 RepID=A0A8H7E738_9EURO|nr:hypothetical protein GJ744_011962 [Endocarpon pusillum]